MVPILYLPLLCQYAYNMNNSEDKVKNIIYRIGFFLFIVTCILGLCDTGTVALIAAILFAYYIVGFICSVIMEHRHPEWDTEKQFVTGYLIGLFVFANIVWVGILW